MKWENITPDSLNAMRNYTPDCGMPFDNRRVTLIAFTMKTGQWWAAHSWGGKKALIDNAERGDVFMCAWTGNYSTSIFAITLADLQKLVKAVEVK